MIEEINIHAPISCWWASARRDKTLDREQSFEASSGGKIGVGGLFDFYSERISRAPQWMREIGMEWLWRLMLRAAADVASVCGWKSAFPPSCLA